MTDAESPERLPHGWTEKFDSKDGQQVKFYHNVITGMKFDSKDDLLRYVELGTPSQGTRQQTRALKDGNLENRLMLMPAETNKAPEWLPQGWIVELNATSRGQKYKRYIDPSTGRKFYSRPDILKYLTSDECNLPAEQIATSIGYINNPLVGESSGAETPLKAEGSQTRKGASDTAIQKLMSFSRPKEFEIVRCEAKGLPPGWIKEIKIEKTGDKIRKDPFFTDPDSKYVFRSCLDALRYLETKSFKTCAIKPKKREDLKFLSADMSIPEEKQSLANTIEECAEKEANHAPTIDQPPRTPVSKRKRGKPVAAPSTDNTMQQEKPAEVIIDPTKYEGKKVISEGTARDNGERTEERGERNNLGPQPFERLGGESSIDPCLDFAFKTLRGDIPVEASNLAAQSYNHHQRASVNVGFPSFSDYARR